MSLSKIVCCFAFILILPVPDCQAQAEVNYAIHANIIYRFTKYINWPGYKKSGDFVIGIVGSSPLYTELKNFLVNKTVGDQKIMIRGFSSSSNLSSCSILFISEDAVGDLKKIVIATERLPVLLVSEGNGLARKGSCINFTVADEHLKLEINKNNIQRRDLNIASELLSLGVVVK